MQLAANKVQRLTLFSRLNSDVPNSSIFATHCTILQMCYKAHLMEPSDIQQLRSRLRETRAIFGERFGVSGTTIGYWENGRSRPKSAHLNGLQRVASSETALPKNPPLPFRPIQYLGSKQRLAHSIAAVVDEVTDPEGRVGDLFAGTSVVSSVIGATRPVTTVDMQAYSCLLSHSLLTSTPLDLSAATSEDFWREVSAAALRLIDVAYPLLHYERQAMSEAVAGDAEKLTDLIEHGSLAVHSQRPLIGCDKHLADVLTKVHGDLEAAGVSRQAASALFYFAGPYFSYEQAIGLDAIAIVAGYRSRSEYFALLAVLLSTASEIVNTVGKQFAQPIKLRKADGRIQPLLLERTIADRSRNVVTTFQSWLEKWREALIGGELDHKVVCGDVLAFVREDTECSTYYADPPYTIDHYSRFYHVLETLVCRDSPALDEMNKRGKPTVMRGVYRQGRYQSLFSIPSGVRMAFDSLFEATARRNTPLVLSYSPFESEAGDRPRLLALTEMVERAQRHYRSVEIVEISDHSHRKLNAKSRNTSVRPDAERLLLCRA